MIAKIGTECVNMKTFKYYGFYVTQRLGFITSDNHFHQTAQLNLPNTLIGVAHILAPPSGLLSFTRAQTEVIPL